MQSRIAQYMNEIVSLTIMALMLLALVAGQAGAMPQQAAFTPLEPGIEDEFGPRGADSLGAKPWVLIDEPGLKVDISFSFRQTGE